MSLPVSLPLSMSLPGSLPLSMSLPGSLPLSNSSGFRFSFSLTFLSSLFLFCIFLVILETSLSKSEFIDFFCWNNGFLICVVVNLEYGSMTGDFITTLKLISVINFFLINFCSSFLKNNLNL